MFRNQEAQDEIACLENKKPSPKQETHDDEEPKPKRQKVDAEVTTKEGSSKTKEGEGKKIKVEVGIVSNERQDEMKHSFNYKEVIDHEIETLNLQVMSK